MFIGLVFLISLIPISAVSSAYPQLSIADIQGDGWSTPYYRQTVETTGIVTADYQYEAKRGFFLQDPIGDGDPSTSDGVFVYAPYYYGLLVDVGDEISITARVTEYYGMTELDYVKDITILSTGNELPVPVELNPPFEDDASDQYYESLEGMYVISSKLRVIQGTDKFGEFAGLRGDLGINRVFQNDPLGTGEIIFVAQDGGLLLNVKSGQILKDLIGPLDYTYGEYRVQPSIDNVPKILPNRSWNDFSYGFGHAFDQNSASISIATFNMLNFFDDIVDPGKLQTTSASSLLTTEELDLKISKLAYAIHENLREPDLIGVEEVEKIELLQRLAGTDPIKADYGVILFDGPDVRGIDVGLMYRLDKVKILGWESKQTCTTLDDGLGPGSDPNYACDDGLNPLFSRRPLVVHLESLKTSEDFYVIVNHFKSKSEGDEVTTPRRVEQASFVGSLVDGIESQDHHAKVIVIGDFNDFEDRLPLTTLEESGLHNLIFKVNKHTRYTYIYNGISECLDHMLVNPSMMRLFERIRIVHFNPDFPFPQYSIDPTTGIASSDHDVIISTFNLGHHHHFSFGK